MRKGPGIGKFRAKLLVAMMLVVSAITGIGLYLAQRSVTANVQRDLEKDFEKEIASLHRVQALRNAALAERCLALASNPRIHAALEDNALDLLYPSARDELRDLLGAAREQAGNQPAGGLHAHFYRFLNGRGAVISPPNPDSIGRLLPEEESQLALPGLRETQQLGYLLRRNPKLSERVDDIIATPIFSTETGQVIAALVAGFKPTPVVNKRAGSGMKTGLWIDNQILIPASGSQASADLNRELGEAIKIPEHKGRSVELRVNASPHLLFHQSLNPASAYRTAYEIYLYPLDQAITRQRRLRTKILGAGALLLMGALAASHVASARLSRPVEKLAIESEEHQIHRREAEASLASTSAELQRSARFSADASHQLKSPVTVLRTGIDSLLARENLPREVYDELSTLLHQTYRLTGVIDDLLLLSRMDAGSLQINFAAVNLTALVEEWLDDLSALPDELNLQIESELPGNFEIAGEGRYISLIVQNLLENAWKYNRPGGRVRVEAFAEGPWALFRVGNTGRTIEPASQNHIFERFHRGAVGEKVPGHGLGLNLARELIRLHRGDLRLARSADDWTEFEARFQLPPEARSKVAFGG